MPNSLGVIKREMCEKLNGKFEFLNPDSAYIIPEERAIAVIKKYEFSWHRTAEKWGDFALRQIQQEYPNSVLLRTRELEPKDWLEKKRFEAVIRFD